MSANDTDPVRTARLRVISELSPVAPPEETVPAIQAIATECGLSWDDVPTLIEDFLEPL